MMKGTPLTSSVSWKQVEKGEKQQLYMVGTRPAWQSEDIMKRVLGIWGRESNIVRYRIVCTYKNFHTQHSVHTRYKLNLKIRNLSSKFWVWWPCTVKNPLRRVKKLQQVQNSSSRTWHYFPIQRKALRSQALNDKLASATRSWKSSKTCNNINRKL